jgi:hypothetical protein
VKRSIPFLIVLLFFFQVSGSEAQCFKNNNAFGDGETISYEVSYNWGPIWVNAGLVTFSAVKEKFLGKDSWHLKSSGKTYTSYDLFFKVRDYYDTWIDPDSFITYEFRRYIYEGGYSLINSLRFDYGKSRVYSNTKRNNDPVKFDTVKLKPCSFDMLASIYFTRTLDFKTLSTNTKIPISVIIDDYTYPIYIKAIGKEVVTNQDGKRYKCIKFTAKMVEGTIFKGDEDILVWVTDDENKIPILIEAKILVGTVKAYLKEAKGLRNPSTALIKD